MRLRAEVWLVAALVGCAADRVRQVPLERIVVRVVDDENRPMRGARVALTALPIHRESHLEFPRSFRLAGVLLARAAAKVPVERRHIYRSSRNGMIVELGAGLTDPDGECTIDFRRSAVGAGPALSAVVERNGGTLAAATWVSLRTGGPSRAELVVRRVSTVHVLVTSRNAPVDRATVMVRPEHGSSFGMDWGVSIAPLTDRNGRARFETYDPVVEIRVTRPGFADAFRVVHVEAGDTEPSVELDASDVVPRAIAPGMPADISYWEAYVALQSNVRRAWHDLEPGSFVETAEGGTRSRLRLLRVDRDGPLVSYVSNESRCLATLDTVPTLDDAELAPLAPAGLETIEVPAGTFECKKYVLLRDGEEEVWVAEGVPEFVKHRWADGTTTVLTSMKLDRR